jgi:hypothetical protein
MLGHSRLSGAVVPPEYEFALELPTPAYNPERAKQLLKEGLQALLPENVR